MKNIIMIVAFFCIFCLHMPSNGQHQIYEIMTAPVLQVAWSPDGEYLAVVSYQGGLKIYNQALELLAGIYLENSPLTVSWSPDNHYLVITKFRKAEIIKWDETSSILTSERVLDNFEDVLDALWGPTGEYIALVRHISRLNLIDERNGQTIYLLRYQIAFWNTNTWQTIINETEYYETRLMSKRFIDSSSLTYAHPVIWNPDGTEILLTATIWSYESDEYPIDYVDFVAINPSDAQRTRNFDLISGTEARIIVWKSGYEDVVSSLQDIGVFDMNIFTGDYSSGFSSTYLDSVVADWSRDGRYLFLDAVLIYQLENIGTFSNSNIETVFTADWHPYRPIIAIGSLTGRLTVEDATQFEGFTASPVANAGESRIVYVGRDLTADVQLDASASVDYDGTITGYEWREGENVLSTYMIADVNLPIGIHDIQLTVTDDDNLTDSVTIQIEAICKTILVTESLSDAISELQNQTEYDTICLEAEGQYMLTASFPDITGDITLIGNGAQIAMTGGSRIFNVTATGALHLKDVTLSGGNATEGGAIYNAGELTLENVILQNNSAVRGGAIYNMGNLVMNGGAIQNNTASEFGGGIYNLGDMQLDGVNIRDNNAPEGSGVYQGE